MNEYCIGLMSGTSLDGVDAVLVRFEADRVHLVETHYQKFDAELKQALQAICFKQTVDLQALGEMDARLGELFAACVNQLLGKARIEAHQIKAIGSHGQTVFHHPKAPYPFSLQIGDANRIAEITGITTISDFRRRDIAASGQGAPLVPAFHKAVFQSSEENRVIVNIGGIANLTVLPKAGKIFGFDSGPGNTLMDYWTSLHLGKPFDENGEWARSGKADERLMKSFMADDYFKQAPPKSTGQEYFSINWLKDKLKPFDLSPADIQASLCQLTADSIAQAIHDCAGDAEKIFICGGGARNDFLIDQIKQKINRPIETTQALGIHPDWVEAMAFAWLAKQTLQGLPGNLPETTGAKKPVILGGIYQAQSS